MITEEDYKKAQTTIDEYNKQLCLSGVSDMLLQKEAIDFVMWCKNNGEFVYQYECNRHYNEILYAKFKKNYAQLLDNSHKCITIMNKTEQKQHLIDMMKDDEDLGLYDEIQPQQIWNKEKMEGIKQLIQDHKQETLEEAAKNYANYNEQMHSAIKEAVIFGAKWQMERSYNEEEVLPLLEILQKCKEYFLLKTDKYSDERADAIIDVMEQFKKK